MQSTVFNFLALLLLKPSNEQILCGLRQLRYCPITSSNSSWSGCCCPSLAFVVWLIHTHYSINREHVNVALVAHSLIHALAIAISEVHLKTNHWSDAIIPHFCCRWQPIESQRDMLDCDHSGKDICWSLTGVNVSWIVWFDRISIENPSYLCVVDLVCARVSEATEAEVHSGRREQPLPFMKVSTRFYLNSFAHSRELSWSQGEVKERRCLMQLITKLTATFSCLVSSNSASTLLGKMRGLITVKLANEQVNCRTKFRNSHFWEMIQLLLRGIKAKGGRKDHREGGKAWKNVSFCFFRFKKTVWFLQLLSQKHAIWS